MNRLSDQGGHDKLQRNESVVSARFVRLMDRVRRYAMVFAQPDGRGAVRARVDSAASRAIERNRLVDALSAYQLTSKTIERILVRLEAAEDGAAGEDGTARSTNVAPEIRRGWEEAQTARSALIRANFGLVVRLAKRQANKGLPLADLVQEGNIGLMRAVDKFDPDRGVRFGTYAGFWIRQSINRALSNQSRLIRMPVYLIERKAKLARTSQALSQENGRKATAQEVADRTGLTVSRIHELLETPKQPLSLDVPFARDSDTKLIELVPDESAGSPLDCIADHRMRQQVRRIVGTLTAREQEVLKLRFGIDQPDGNTLQQIGRRFSLSRERVRQIEQEALDKLRAQAEAEELDSVISG